MSSAVLSTRARRLLATLVQHYIETGEPVSSQVLARESRLGVSSATVRNAVAELERDGYLHQPHTSAGRVPTDLGYRAFVDLLLGSRRPGRPPAMVQSHFRQRAWRSPLVDDVLLSVSHMVSRAAGNVGFALAETQDAVLQRIEFVPLAPTRVLVVVVSRGNMVTQKVVEGNERFSPDDLVQAANYLNTEFVGLPLNRVREAVLERLQQDRTLYNQLLSRALRLAQQTLDTLPAQQTFFVEGAASLLDGAGPDRVSLATLRALLEMMDEKERLVSLLNEYIDGPGLTVVIGAEHASPDLQPFSLIASTAVDGSTVRTVGVIGPTRMHYQKTIALVDGTTQEVSRVLRHSP
jgi:heat-inducible transcriptional repressor